MNIVEVDEMKQLLLEPIKPHICRICGNDYQIYGDDKIRVCDGCHAGMNVYFSDEWLEKYFGGTG